MSFCPEVAENGSQRLSCDRTSGHGGDHHCPTWRTNWRATPRVSRPRARKSPPVCQVSTDCNLAPTHRGPCGVQEVLV